jgi:hypothetical protein
MKQVESEGVPTKLKYNMQVKRDVRRWRTVVSGVVPVMIQDHYLDLFLRCI